ncbi:Methyltransferase [Rhodococcus sp. RD6.2]|jgi:release factor glutamine methyltransferase|uniref:methyltransferase n=1 Tax=Rhodococcus sp. RD6.2 TaxID=260936 RepID=UPI00063B4D5F|nr:methyltransferase [Rhodococcus sp. RD6.2]CRK51176.1 Methyltransferase [Rhodococcus sp. RD6.2]
MSPSETVRAERATRPGVLRLPGVYAPQADTWLLADTLRTAGVPNGAKILDYCTGSGAVALAAADCGASEIVAVDVSTRAVVSAWLNSWWRRLPIRVARGGLDVARRRGPYDVVVANPPYVPISGDGTAQSRNWDGGPSGRRVVGPLCRQVRSLLRPGGFALIVHSEVAGIAHTVGELRASGLKAAPVARTRVPFGPVMSRQSANLTASGLIELGQNWEELVVIRGDRPD